MHFVLSDAGGARLRGEVTAEPEEPIPLRIALDEQGLPHVWCRGRNILLLPADPRYDPAPPILPRSPEAGLDVVLVVDGTMRHFGRAEPGGIVSSPLLDQKDLWAEHAGKLTSFVEELVRGRDWRAAVLAFGDQEPPAVTAQDLRPLYRLHPPEEEERRLRPLGLELLHERLLGLPSTPGGDFVDALADALDACARLRWREAARKLVVLTGDSPGHSLLHPLRKGADLCVRERDVDTQALRLHRLGVEVITLYRGPAADLGLHEIGFQRDLLAAARAQYARLASVPEMAFEASAFYPERMAERLRQPPWIVARGAALGEWTAAERQPRAGPAVPAAVTVPGPFD